MTKITDLFDAGDTPYVIDRLCSGTPAQVARQMMSDLFRENPHGVVWTFYRKGLFRTSIRDGLAPDGLGTVHIARTKNRFSLFEITESIDGFPLDRYLEGVCTLYMQLCGGRDMQKCVGLETSPQGTAIGHYDFG